MQSLEVHQFLLLKDNYGVLIHDPASRSTAAVDAADAAAIRCELDARGWKLTHILVTHHHADHTGGCLELKAATGCTIIGPRAEASRIPGIDRAVGQGDTIVLGSHGIHVLDTPGHTLGHISYWIPSANMAFVGDTLFAMGCGRVLEGNYEMMWASLDRIRALPPETMLYCGHEYTLANARFGLTIEPGNAALRRRAEEVEKLRADCRPTLPTPLALELETNVFLRPHKLSIRSLLGMQASADWRVFGEIRARKNKAT